MNPNSLYNNLINQTNMTFKKRLPKQNFDINFEVILQSTLLSLHQRVLLMNILIHHKANKFAYKHILNNELCRDTSFTTPTLIKHRDKLEELKLIKVKVKFHEKTIEVEKSKRKNSPLYYYPNWNKLKSLNFIKDKNDSKKFSEKVSNQFKKNLNKGTILNISHKKHLKDDSLYNIKEYRCENGIKSGVGQKKTLHGKTINRLILRQNLKVQRKETREYEYLFLSEAKKKK